MQPSHPLLSDETSEAGFFVQYVRNYAVDQLSSGNGRFDSDRIESKKSVIGPKSNRIDHWPKSNRSSIHLALLAPRRGAGPSVSCPPCPLFFPSRF